jgi:hypothetical protein
VVLFSITWLFPSRNLQTGASGTASSKAAMWDRKWDSYLKLENKWNKINYL